MVDQSANGRRSHHLPGKLPFLEDAQSSSAFGVRLDNPVPTSNIRALENLHVGYEYEYTKILCILSMGSIGGELLVT